MYRIPAMMRDSREMQKTSTVKAVEMVRPVVTRSLPAKYLWMSYQGPLSSFER